MEIAAYAVVLLFLSCILPKNFSANGFLKNNNIFYNFFVAAAKTGPV
jgi:hypothetical protein